MCNSACRLPNGQTYNLCDQSQRDQARIDNPAYVVDDSGYLLRGSGGAPSSDPARGGNGNDGGTGTGRQVLPVVEGGIGTASPGGYSGAPIPPSQQQQLLQTVQDAANNIIPSGPGGSGVLDALAQIVNGAVAQVSQVASTLTSTHAGSAAHSASGSNEIVLIALAGFGALLLLRKK